MPWSVCFSHRSSRYLLPALLSALRGVLGDRGREEPLVRCGQRGGRRGKKTLPQTDVPQSCRGSRGGSRGKPVNAQQRKEASLLWLARQDLPLAIPNISQNRRQTALVARIGRQQ